MYLGKVVGNVVCSVQSESLNGRTLLLVQRIPGGSIAVGFLAIVIILTLRPQGLLRAKAA